jgi:DNA-binding transcriptional regulator YiaG
MMPRPVLTTSAGYAASLYPFVIVRQILGLAGTTVVEAFEVIPPPQTNAGATPIGAPSSSTVLTELRRLSGLSWDQLARVLGVSRRALHFWASGKRMASSNEEHLQRVLAVLRAIDRGSSSANRTALLGALDGDTLVADVLANREYERAVSLASRLSAPSRRAKLPLPPEVMASATHETVHRDPGPTRRGRSVRANRRK